MIAWLIANADTIIAAVVALGSIAKNIQSSGTMKEMVAMFNEQEQPNEAILDYAKQTVKNKAYNYLVKRLQ